MMNCKRCHHTYEAHADGAAANKDSGSDAIMGVGGCIVPACRCRQYESPIVEIDEDLL